MSVLKKFLFVLASALTVLGHGTVHAQATKADYRAIVGVNSTSFSFKTVQKPESLQTANLGTSFAVKRIDYEVFSDSVGRLKFFLPPGTVAFNANLYYYLAPQEGKVALRLNQPPATPLSSITANNAGGVLNETVLQNLINGQEKLYYSAGAPANSMVLSSPDNAIAPMTTGGYLYGNYQYPGDLLQRGLIQVFVKADCYAQWFNSSSTKWDVSENPDENATHTCDGSTGGGTGGGTGTTLQDVTLSAYSLQVGVADASITLAPSPSTATLPTCTVEGTAYVGIAANKITLLASASNLTATTNQTIVCGSFRKTIAIIPSNGSRVEKLASTTDASGNLVLNVKLVRTASDIAGKTTASFWVAARIPTDGFFFTEDEWFFLTPQSWKQLVLPNPNSVVYESNKAVQQETTFAIPLGLTASDLAAFNVEIHFGYADTGGVFQNKGAIWTKN